MTPSNWLSRVEAFPKKNILTPIGALAVAVLGTCACAAVAVWPAPISWVFLCIGIVPLAVAVWAYVFFAIRDPDRLQTEDYRIQKEYVARVVAYVDGKEISLDPSTLRITGNPAGPTGKSS